MPYLNNTPTDKQASSKGRWALYKGFSLKLSENNPTSCWYGRIVLPPFSSDCIFHFFRRRSLRWFLAVGCFRENDWIVRYSRRNRHKVQQMLFNVSNSRFHSRFLLTKWAIFYSIEGLETNTYNSLLFAGLLNRNRGLNRFISVLLVLGSNFEYWRSGPAELILCLLAAQPDYCRTPKISFLEKVQCWAKEPLQQF